MILTVAQVAAGTRCPLDAVAVNWPILCDALAKHGLDTGPVEVAVAARVAVETRYTFRPVREQWARGQTPEEYFARYAPPHPVAKVLGNRDVADAVAFRGAGFPQLTGRFHFAHYGNALTPPIDLVATPERALDPGVSAEITALFCKDKGMPALAARGDYAGCSRVWNGGDNGLPEYLAMTDVLATHLVEDAPPAPE